MIYRTGRKRPDIAFATSRLRAANSAPNDSLSACEAALPCSRLAWTLSRETSSILDKSGSAGRFSDRDGNADCAGSCNFSGTRSLDQLHQKAKIAAAIDLSNQLALPLRLRYHWTVAECRAGRRGLLLKAATDMTLLLPPFRVIVQIRVVIAGEHGRIARAARGLASRSARRCRSAVVSPRG